MAGRLVGFSTGALYKLNMTFGQSIEAIRELGCNAIELSFLKSGTCPGLDMRRGDARVDSLDSFSHVGLHAPLMKYDRGERTATVLHRLRRLQQNNFDKDANLVIFHPDMVVDFGVIAGAPFYKGTVAFENMDSRKQSFRGMEEMSYLLKFHPNFQMCLDVNHALTNNQGLAEAFTVTLGPKIKQVHLSGLDGAHGHTPLFKTEQAELIKQALSANVPIIIESVVESLEEMRQEYEYVMKALRTFEFLAGLREKFSSDHPWS